MSKELTQNMGQFDELLSIIDSARTRALKAVNAELIQMYWNVGEYLSGLCANSGFGDKVIDEVAAYIATANPGVKGFNRRGLYRMKQFYETYKDNEFVTPLVTQISWTNHLLILSGAKSAEERHFYMTLCAKEHYSKRELERQIDSAYYERYMLSAKKLVPKSVPQDVRGSILDTYVLEFLDLPEQFSERNLRKAITDNLKQFILEFGKDFTFIGEEYRIQVGGQDFYIDLLFYNRALSCLVPIELKIGNFKPEHIGQINFYLKALDRDVKKPNENPSVGVILCAGKDEMRWWNMPSAAVCPRHWYPITPCICLTRSCCKTSCVNSLSWLWKAARVTKNERGDLCPLFLGQPAGRIHRRPAP